MKGGGEYKQQGLKVTPVEYTTPQAEISLKIKKIKMWWRIQYE